MLGKIVYCMIGLSFLSRNFQWQMGNIRNTNEEAPLSLFDRMHKSLEHFFPFKKQETISELEESLNSS